MPWSLVTEVRLVVGREAQEKLVLRVQMVFNLQIIMVGVLFNDVIARV